MFDTWQVVGSATGLIVAVAIGYAIGLWVRKAPLHVTITPADVVKPGDHLLMHMPDGRGDDIRAFLRPLLPPGTKIHQLTTDEALLNLSLLSDQLARDCGNDSRRNGDPQPLERAENLPCRLDDAPEHGRIDETALSVFVSELPVAPVALQEPIPDTHAALPSSEGTSVAPSQANN